MLALVQLAFVPMIAYAALDFRLWRTVQLADPVFLVSVCHPDQMRRRRSDAGMPNLGRGPGPVPSCVSVDAYLPPQPCILTENQGQQSGRAQWLEFASKREQKAGLESGRSRADDPSLNFRELALPTPLLGPCLIGQAT